MVDELGGGGLERISRRSDGVRRPTPTFLSPLIGPISQSLITGWYNLREKVSCLDLVSVTTVSNTKIRRKRHRARKVYLIIV